MKYNISTSIAGKKEVNNARIELCTFWNENFQSWQDCSCRFRGSLGVSKAAVVWIVKGKVLEFAKNEVSGLIKRSVIECDRPYLAHGWCWLHCAGWWRRRSGDPLSIHSAHIPVAVLGLLLFVRQSTLQWNHFEQQSDNIALVYTIPAQFHHWHCCTRMAKAAHHRLILHTPSRRGFRGCVQHTEHPAMTSRNCIISNNLEYIAL